jgi:hypothetical protein
MECVRLKKSGQSCFPAAWGASNLDLGRYIQEFDLEHIRMNLWCCSLVYIPNTVASRGA